MSKSEANTVQINVCLLELDCILYYIFQLWTLMAKIRCVNEVLETPPH